MKGKFERYKSYERREATRVSELQYNAVEEHGVFVTHKMYKRFGNMVGSNAGGKVFVTFDDKEDSITVNASEVISM